MTDTMAFSQFAAYLILAAAPGEAPPTYEQVPEIAKAAIERRLGDGTVQLGSLQVKPSDTMPGFVACGVATETFADRSRNRRERFFVIAPGNFAILDRDGKELVDHYWSLNRC
jgi:hypothetical protein